MTKTALALVVAFVVLAIPSAMTAWELGVVEGLLHFFKVGQTDIAVLQGFVDLVVALSILVVWMVQDARSRGVAFAPYILLTLLLGSFGPLTYLIRRELQLAKQSGDVDQ